jgi:hypothetical protein
MKKTYGRIIIRPCLCALAIVAGALVSFIACTAPDADKNEPTPAGTVASTKTKSATVTVNVSLPQATSREISLAAGRVLLDYYEIYFLKHDHTTPIAANEIFFGSGVPGGRAASITLEGIDPTVGTRFDVLLLGGRQATADANRILLAVDYQNDGTEPAATSLDTPSAETGDNNYGVLIMPNRVNAITLTPDWVETRLYLWTTDTAGDEAQISIGFAHMGYVASSPTDTVAFYPGLYMQDATALLDAGFNLDGGTSWGSGKYGVSAIDTMNWKAGPSPGNVRTLSYSSDLTSAIKTTPNGRLKVVGAPIKFKAAGYVSTDDAAGVTLNSVANTYGKIYAHLSFNPFGQTHKGSKWHIQSGLNYQNLCTVTSEGVETIDGGAFVLKFGDPDNANCHLPDSGVTAPPPVNPLGIEVEGF